MYLNMSWNRLISIVHLLYDFASVLLLIFGLAMVDVPNTWRFLLFLTPYLASGILVRLIRTGGQDGLGKSESGAVAFEVMFRFVAMKGLFTALWKGREIEFKVTDKRTTAEKRKDKMIDPLERDWVKNLRRTWFNIMMAILLSLSICYAVVNPPRYYLNETMDLTNDSVLPVTLALGFATANLLPHLLAIYLCFIPLVSGWMMEDLVHGRCDQYAVNPVSGKRYVPRSFISLLNISQMLLIFGSIIVLSLHSAFKR